MSNILYIAWAGYDFLGRAIGYNIGPPGMDAELGYDEGSGVIPNISSVVINELIPNLEGKSSTSMVPSITDITASKPNTKIRTFPTPRMH